MNDPTDLSPAEWQQYLANAMTALHQNHRDTEALQAVRDANEALAAYDQAEAASPSERIRAGITGGLQGLGQAALDIPRGIAGTIAHPIQTLLNLPKVPGALAQAVSSNDPATVARGIGNIGSLLLPLAKAGKAAPVLSAVRRAATAPIRGPLALLERPGLTNQLLRAKIAKLNEPTPAPGLPPAARGLLAEHAARPIGGPLEDIAAAQADLAAGKITSQDFNTAMEMASQRVNQPPQGLLAPQVEMPAFTRGPQAMSVEAMQGRAGLPTRAAKAEAAQIQARLAQMGKGRVQPYYPRGGQAEQTLPPPSVQSPPVIGPASPEVIVRQTPYAQLMEALQNPQTPARIKQAVLQELQRRGIVGQGLLAPAMGR